MTTVIVVGEGRTEQTFVRDVLAPPSAERGVYLECRLIPTSSESSGGALSRDRVLRYLRNTLLQRKDAYVTTLFDLYALDRDFPGRAEAGKEPDPLKQAAIIEQHLKAEVLNIAGCQERRFLPYIQPHEFEALLFSRPEALIEVESRWRPRLSSLIEVRESFPTPEHINHGKETCPSARLESLLIPRYRKVLHGAATAGRIGLMQLRKDCVHFGGWLAQLEALQPL
jgi:Domain of unknown function (DUF4276)